jgi:hypothetical protein
MIDFLEFEAGVDKTILMIIMQGEITSINRLLLIKVASELTFHSNEYTFMLLAGITWR